MDNLAALLGVPGVDMVQVCQAPRRYWLFAPELQWQPRGKWRILQGANTHDTGYLPLGVNGVSHRGMRTRVHGGLQKVANFARGRTWAVRTLRLRNEHRLERAGERTTTVSCAVYPWIATVTHCDLGVHSQY